MRRSVRPNPRLPVRKSFGRRTPHDELRQRPRCRRRLPLRGEQPLLPDRQGNRPHERLPSPYQDPQIRRDGSGQCEHPLHGRIFRQGERVRNRCRCLQPGRRQDREDPAQKTVHLHRAGRREPQTRQILDPRSARRHRHRVQIPQDVEESHLHPVVPLPARHTRSPLPHAGPDPRILQVQPQPQRLHQGQYRRREHERFGRQRFGHDLIQRPRNQGRCHGHPGAQTRGVRLVPERFSVDARIRAVADRLPGHPHTQLHLHMGERERYAEEKFVRHPLPHRQPVQGRGRRDKGRGRQPRGENPRGAAPRTVQNEMERKVPPLLAGAAGRGTQPARAPGRARTSTSC